MKKSGYYTWEGQPRPKPPKKERTSRDISYGKPELTQEEKQAAQIRSEQKAIRKQRTFAFKYKKLGKNIYVTTERVGKSKAVRKAGRLGKKGILILGKEAQRLLLQEKKRRRRTYKKKRRARRKGVL